MNLWKGYYHILNLQADIKINHGKFIWKLINKQHPECMQSNYHTNTNSAMNRLENNQNLLYHFTEQTLVSPL